MTRINVGVSPKELPTKLLLAEHREMTRIPNAILSGKANLVNLPKKFCLNTGHVRFFYDKQLYLFIRYLMVNSECHRRMLNIIDKHESFREIQEQHPELWNDYKEIGFERQLIIERIESKGLKLRSVDQPVQRALL